MKKSRAYIEAMEARSVEAIPDGSEWQYEPKWDGFRCLLTRNVDAVAMHSKSGQDLGRYFPEVAAAALTLREKSFVLDGELVVPVSGRFSFDNLLQRIHPATSRIKKLSEQTPALFLAFDLLRKGKSELAAAPLRQRRIRLEDFAARCFPGASLFRLSPASLKLKDAERWLASAGGGSDGVIAKRLDLPYQAGNREGMQKIKRHRSADCVIGGFRYAENPQGGRRSSDLCCSVFMTLRVCSITWDFLRASRQRISRLLPLSSRLSVIIEASREMPQAGRADGPRNGRRSGSR